MGSVIVHYARSCRWYLRDGVGHIVVVRGSRDVREYKEGGPRSSIYQYQGLQQGMERGKFKNQAQAKYDSISWNAVGSKKQCTQETKTGNGKQHIKNRTESPGQ